MRTPHQPIQNSLPNITHLAGIALLGMVFPEVGSFLLTAHTGDFTLKGLATAQMANPSLWLLDFVPIALVAAALRAPVVTDVPMASVDTTSVKSLTSRIEELEREINQRDLRLEEVGVLLGVSSQIRQSLLESVRHPCFILDCDGKITDANEAFWKLTPVETNPNLSFYADQLLDVQVDRSRSEMILYEMEIGMLAQNDVQQISFRSRDDLPMFSCQISRLGERGGPIGALWTLHPEDRVPQSSEQEGNGFHDEQATPQDHPDPPDENETLPCFQGIDAFRGRLDEEYARAVMNNLPLSLLLIDLENFRLFNHRYGKAAGDKALVSIAEVIRFCARDGDCAARYSGDVFAALLPNTEQEGSIAFAERLRKAIELKSEAGLPVLAHIACATLEDGQSLAMFGESAGRALAHAKSIRSTKIVHFCHLPDDIRAF